MSQTFKLDRRAFLNGTAGMTLALPVLEAMGKEVAEKTPRRFCALYTANGGTIGAANVRDDCPCVGPAGENAQPSQCHSQPRTG